MTPQIPGVTTPVPSHDPVPMPSRRRSAVWIPVGVIAGVIALLILAGGRALRPVPRIAVRPVLFDRTDAPRPTGPGTPQRPATRTVQAPGWLEADPYLVACSALTDGVIAEMLVLEGDRVEKGQPVARLVRANAELAVAQAAADVRAAEGELGVARADLDAARTRWDQPIDRERAVGVARAELARVEARIAQLPALIDAERASVEQTEEELTRTRRAFESGAANEIEVVLLTKRAEGGRASVEALEKQRAILEAEGARAWAELQAAERNAGLRVEERRALDGASAAVTVAEGRLARARAALAEASLGLERTEVVAPVAGIVQRRLKGPGDKVMLGMDDPASAQVVHLYDPAMLQARVDVPLADASQVFVGQRCEVVVEVLPDTTFTGEVTRITHEADLQKNTLQVKVRVVDPSPMLRPEMLTRVKFLGNDVGGENNTGFGVGTARAVFVPQGCVVGGDGDAAVFAVRDRRSGRGVVESVGVVVEGTADGWARVTGDLRPGDLLAADPAGVRDGQRVRIVGDEAEEGAT